LAFAHVTDTVLDVTRVPTLLTAVTTNWKVPGFREPKVRVATPDASVTSTHVF
jgi:hypothetical protein